MTEHRASYRYVRDIRNRVVYSIGDTHGRGREVVEFIARLEMQSCLRGEERPIFVQLGDLCDHFALPADRSWQNLSALNAALINSSSVLHNAFYSGIEFGDWHREGDCICGYYSGKLLLERQDSELQAALYSALKSYETLVLYAGIQLRHPEDFCVVFGNHDADLIRGNCAYGRRQKHILFGLLGFSPDEVCAHMIEGGTPHQMLERSSLLAWLNGRPHLAISDDTVYMHGGPTAVLSERLSQTGDEGFHQWLSEIDAAREAGHDSRHFEAPVFEEHRSFLAPDGADNDWLKSPHRIMSFLRAADRQYLAVGHSPFLDFEKGLILDLTDPGLKARITTPALLPPNGCLIKHDTDMKRVGGLWACRHEVGTDVWTAIRADDMQEYEIRR
jgi:hypothetical protein